MNFSKKFTKKCEKFKHTCLLMSMQDSRTVEEATKNYNEEHCTNIDFRFCAVFRYNNLKTLKFGCPPFYLYKEFILL